jgi:hypothetical protein
LKLPYIPIVDRHNKQFKGDKMLEQPCANRTEVPISTSAKRDIHIQQLSYGYLVTVGCKSFAIENMDKLITNLQNYLINPEEVEKNYLEGFYKL